MEWELEDVERRFIDQLVTMDWTHVAGSLDEPGLTQRASFARVVQEPVLRQKLHELNLRDGEPWLDEGRLSEAVSALTRVSASELVEANQIATELLLKGFTVDGLPDWNAGRGQTIQYIDWAHPEHNQFTVINQFRVDCPPGHDRGKGFVVPDLVLFVNGIPLVVVECKSPSVTEPLAEAIDQLRRYSNQRRANFEVEDNEGNESLFHTSQLLIATSFDHTRVGCIGASFDDFASWKTVTPLKENDVAASLGKEKLSEQERTIAGMLSKSHLLDIVRHFTLFMQPGGQTIKAVCRYQQFRAVSKAVQRLQSGKTRQEDGEYDRRGGLIWHTQGSGKSLTMVFLVRKLRTDPKLRRFKVILVTDRKDLQRQLSETAALTGETVEIATTRSALANLVRRKGPGLVFGTVQKYRNADEAGEDPLNVEDLPKYQVAEKRTTEVLNDDSSILVLVDEAHRSHTNDLHAYLMASMPNCAKIGFTGTPLIMGEKKRTYQIFGDLIDRYTIRESEQDGSTVPALYEGRARRAEGDKRRRHSR